MLPFLRDKDRPYPKAETVRRGYSLDAARGTPRFWRHGTWLVGLPLALSLLWLTVECLCGHWRIFQAGPVSAAHHPAFAASHASFNDDCTRCHTQHFRTWQRLAPWNHDLHTVPDAGCVGCHTASLRPGESFFPTAVFLPGPDLIGRPAPPHHTNAAAAPACAACHHEHPGSASLSRVADQACKACHGRLGSLVPGGTPLGNITSFATDHPDFVPRTLPDPGRIHFNHAVHMNPKGVLVKHSGEYKQLECSACHTAGPAEPLMQPVNYEQHCAGCHPLSVAVLGTFDEPALRKAAQQFNGTPAPHREPAVVRRQLHARFAAFLRDNPSAPTVPILAGPARPIPGEPPAPPQPAEPAEWLRSQVEAAERMLFEAPGGCRHCHTEEPKANKADGLPSFAASAIPTRWLRHSFFSHAAQGHREIDCSHCHDAKDSRRAGDVLLPGIAVCRECHAPQRTAGTECIECHRYHDPALVDPSRRAPTVREGFSAHPSLTVGALRRRP
jgi:hypothetical protein